jgi:hypothetical protein
MRALKRIAILLLELVLEALSLGTFLGAMCFIESGEPGVVLGSIIALPVILGIYGYYISRILAAITWASKARWLYPVTAAAVFFAHVLYLASQFKKTDLTPLGHALILPFLIGGACIVFACAFTGNQLSRKWRSLCVVL